MMEARVIVEATSSLGLGVTAAPALLSEPVPRVIAGDARPVEVGRVACVAGTRDGVPFLGAVVRVVGGRVARCRIGIRADVSVDASRITYPPPTRFIVDGVTFLAGVVIVVVVLFLARCI